MKILSQNCLELEIVCLKFGLFAYQVDKNNEDERSFEKSHFSTLSKCLYV